MVLGDESLIIWFLLLVSPRGAVESNDGQSRAVIEAQELELGFKQIQLGQTQIGDILLAGIKNHSGEANAFLVERYQLGACTAGSRHELSDSVMGLADLAGALPRCLGAALARGDGLGAGLGATGLTRIKNRQGQSYGWAERPVAVALGVETGSGTFHPREAGEGGFVFECGKLPAVGLDFRACAQAVRDSVGFIAQCDLGVERSVELPVDAATGLAEAVGEGDIGLAEF